MLKFLEEYVFHILGKLVEEIAPRSVMVYTIDRDTPAPNLEKVSVEELRAIGLAAPDTVELLHALRAKAGVSHMGRVTGGAFLRYLQVRAAPMANQLAVGIRAVFDVVGHGNRAMRAGHSRAAGCAGNKAVVAAAV